MRPRDFVPASARQRSGSTAPPGHRPKRPGRWVLGTIVVALVCAGPMVLRSAEMPQIGKNEQPAVRRLDEIPVGWVAPITPAVPGHTLTPADPCPIPAVDCIAGPCSMCDEQGWRALGPVNG